MAICNSSTGKGMHLKFADHSTSTLKPFFSKCGNSSEQSDCGKNNSLERESWMLSWGPAELLQAALGICSVFLGIPHPTSLQLQHCSPSRLYPTFPRGFPPQLRWALQFHCWLLITGFCHTLLTIFLTLQNAFNKLKIRQILYRSFMKLLSSIQKLSKCLCMPSLFSRLFLGNSN